MTGRPPMLYDEATGDTICELVASGLSLRQVCRDHPELPGQTTIFKWLALNDAFAKQYAHSCEARAEVLADEMFDIADDGSNDWMETQGGDGSVGYKLNGEHVQRSKLRIDTRKWALSKMMPKKYGDKIDHTLGNPDGSAIVFQTVIEKKPE